MKKIITGMIAVALITGATAQNFPNAVKQKTINVSGMAEMEVVPDEIFVQVELREYKKNTGKVDIESIKSRFIKSVMGLGISDTNISVQGYSGWDGNYWWYRRNKKKNPDMMASITYWVKLNSTQKMDELVEKMDDEATQNFFIAKVSHSRMTDFKKQLKVQAVKAAKEKAGYLAAAIGENVGEALTINEPNEIGYYEPRAFSNAMMKESMAMDGGGAGNQASPNIDFKKIKYQFEVNVVFALK